MRKERVLIVDDEIDFVEALAERLETRGVDVDQASSGGAALKMVDERRYDMVVLDLAMPGMDGIETLRAMRDSHPDLQVILLTGRATVKKSVEAIKLGAIDLLEKPTQIEALMDRIHAAKANVDKQEEQRTTALIGDILKSKGW
jgi:DNA-binding NtrC family response regulator